LEIKRPLKGPTDVKPNLEQKACRLRRGWNEDTVHPCYQKPLGPFTGRDSRKKKSFEKRGKTATAACRGSAKI